MRFLLDTKAYNHGRPNQRCAENKVSFKDTLNLPRTDFPIRANAKIDDPAMIARWEKEELYDTII